MDTCFGLKRNEAEDNSTEFTQNNDSNIVPLAKKKKQQAFRPPFTSNPKQNPCLKPEAVHHKQCTTPVNVKPPPPSCYESGVTARKPCFSRDLLNPTKKGLHDRLLCGEETAKSSAIDMDAEQQAQYYSVLYCRRKKGPEQKGKGPWSDGVLSVIGRKCILQDIEGKVITTKVDYNRQVCKNTMIEGVNLQISMFHLEVVREALSSEYNSGALFMRNRSPNSDCLASVQRDSKRPFSQHSQFKAARYEASSTPSIVLHPDAFILNTKTVQEGGTPIFIDPYLSTKLRPHQREGVKFMFECVMGLRAQTFTGCLLADEMGLGKTLQVITLIWTLLQQVSRVRSEFKRALVVCPTSLVQNWGNEVRKWLGSERLRAIVVHGGIPGKEVKQQYADFKSSNVHPLLITSYELLRKYADVIESAKTGLLVCDEAHRLKNCAGNKTIDALLALNCPRRILLTGTPVQNDLNEFYAMMEFANPNLLGPLSVFKRLYTDPIERSRDRSASTEEKDIGQERSLGLQKRTQFCILRRSASINRKYLPPKTEYIVFCRPQLSQISLYLEFCSSVVNHAMQSTGPSAKVLLAICMLRKLCNHPKFVDNTFSETATGTSLTSGIVESLADTDGKEGSQKQQLQYRFEPGESGLSGKLQCLDSLLSAVFNVSSDIMDRVVIVSNFTQCLDMIQGLCDHRCWKWIRLDGTTDTSSRQQLVDHFNKGFGDELIFLLSSKAGGTGLNLIGANRLVLFDPDWNPAIDAQAMARIWREGQPKPVIIYRLLTTGSIEEKIYQRQVMKGEFAATIEGHGEARFLSKKGGQHFSREELKELFTLRLDTSCDTYDLLSHSKMSNLEDWKDHSKIVTDFALKDAIESGIITFVRQITDNSNKDIC